MPVLSPRSSLVEKLPSVQITVGWMSSTWLRRYSLQDSISLGCGSRLLGGRHLTVLQMNTSLRSSPISPRSLLRSLPAWPTNGSPCLSSLAPGASPTNIRSASALPEPNTTVVRVWCSGQRVQLSRLLVDRFEPLPALCGAYHGSAMLESPSDGVS